MRSLDQTAGSVAANGTDDAIVAAIARSRRMLLYMILLCITFVPKYTTSPATLHRRDTGLTLLATIENGSPAMWRRVFRMTKPSFNALCGWLASNTMFRRGREVSEREKLLIFLYIVCQGTPQNIVAHLLNPLFKAAGAVVIFRSKMLNSFKHNSDRFCSQSHGFGITSCQSASLTYIAAAMCFRK